MEIEERPPAKPEKNRVQGAGGGSTMDFFRFVCLSWSGEGWLDNF